MHRVRTEVASAAATRPDRLRVGLVQSAPRAHDAAANAIHLRELSGQLGDVDLIVTPELGLPGYALAPAPDLVPTTLQHVVADQARPGTVVGVGFAEERPDGKPFNTFTLIGDAGAEVQRKLHPVATPPFDEHLVFEAGDVLRAVSIRGVPTATVVCNDMWHPVVPWLAVQQGAEVLVVPVASAESEMPGVKQVWEAILRHTAQVLQCYVVFVNRCGVDGSLQFWGGSRVIGPDGEVMIQLGRTEAVNEVTLDLELLRRLRARTPILAEVRTDFVLHDLAETTISSDSISGAYGQQTEAAPVHV